MTILQIMVQVWLDGLLFSLCSLGFLGRSRGRLDYLLSLVFSGVCLIVRLGIGNRESDLAYTLLPIDGIVFFVFLFLAVLLIHSLWFHTKEGHTFFGTVAVFSLYLLLRTFSSAAFYLCGLSEIFWYLYGNRVLSVLLWLVLQASGALGWLRGRLADGDVPVRVVFSNIAVLLLLVLTLFQFDFIALFRHFPIVAGVLALLVLGNGIVILTEQHRIQTLRKNQLLERYLPLVEELVEQVRSRQHEFNNRMMAVSAALETADSLREARESVSSLLQQVKLNDTDRELLRCDSKVISGMLFGKIKQAEMKHIRLEVTIAGAFLHRTLPESDWVEVIGILLDNAMEASPQGAVLYAGAMEENGGFRFTVSNPYRALSNVEFVQMFRRAGRRRETAAEAMVCLTYRKLWSGAAEKSSLETRY